MEPLASIETKPFKTRQDINYADKFANTMICYFQREIKPLYSDSLKQAQEDKAGKAIVKIEVLMKEVNNILNDSCDPFLRKQFNKFRQQE